MIEFTTGDILRADTEALVNTVNCVGIMGRGIALQFKNDFPANFKAYEAACAREEVQPGRMFVFETGLSAIRSSSSTSRPSGTGGARAGWRISTPAEGAGRGNSRSRHSLHRHPAARQRPGRAELGRGAPAHRSGAARHRRSPVSSSSSRTARRVGDTNRARSRT